MSETEKQPNWFMRLKSGQQNLVVLAGLVLVFGVVVALGGLTGSGGDGGSSVSEERGAKDVCETFVERRLKAPSTAEFGDATASQDGDVWTVSGVVDAENSFGAPIRNDYTCTVTPADDEATNWTLVDLQLAE